ncbi:hypothetical protein [Tabrizicola sp.]|uniref:hypothetical protein n=1 Tax=Tabrizicola sp. TaxID=2005166 RepID=UPI0025F93D66|nr:hypothetical protein [Tabrizicola sp.]
MPNRRKMGPGDWLTATAFLAMGLFLGLALANMVLLVGTASWPIIILIPLLFAGVLVFDSLLGRLFGRFFPSGVRPASHPAPKERRPLVLLLSLPAGLVIGVVGARFGLDDLLL